MKKEELFKRCLLSFMILTISILGFSKETVINSTWVNMPQQVDGSDADWAIDVLNFKKKYDVHYAFRNDAENLYVLFIFKNPKYLSSINFTGITLYFNTEGKKKKNYGINFKRKQISADEYISLIEKKIGQVPEDKKDQIRKTPQYVIFDNDVICKKAESDELPKDQEVRPAIFRFGRQQKMVVYEFAIPLKRVAELTAGVGAETGEAVKVGFEWGGSTKETKEQMKSRMGSAATRTRATKAGGLTSERTDAGGLSPSMASMRRFNPKKYAFWVDVQLAKNQ